MGVFCSRDHTQEQLSREQLLQELNLTRQALQKCLHSLQASSDRVKFLTDQVAELEDQKDQVFKHTQIFPV